MVLARPSSHEIFSELLVPRQPITAVAKREVDPVEACAKVLTDNRKFDPVISKNDRVILKSDRVISENDRVIFRNDWVIFENDRVIFGNDRVVFALIMTEDKRNCRDRQDYQDCQDCQDSQGH